MFGQPIFAAPAIPNWKAGQLGPRFLDRPTPQGFPNASAGYSACAGCGSTALMRRAPVSVRGFGTAAEDADAAAAAIAAAAAEPWYMATWAPYVAAVVGFLVVGGAGYLVVRAMKK